MTDPVRVGVTGAGGLLGWHLRCRLLNEPATTTIACTRDQFADQQQLEAFVDQCDVIVHLAGANRGSDEEIEQTNVELARRLAKASESRGLAAILFANSTQVNNQTAYGRSKAQAASLLSEAAARAGIAFTNLIIPHVFGETGRPFYNSVVSTFCHQLTSGEMPDIKNDIQLELLHAQDLADEITSAIQDGVTGNLHLSGNKITVSALLGLLQSLWEEYLHQVIPDLSDPFRLALFNTLRSYAYPSHYPVSIKSHSDSRGILTEAVRSKNAGQVFFSTTAEGITRGNHYHRRKVERFVVLQGEATIRIRRVLHKPVEEIRVRGDHPSYVDIPTLHTHNITNTGRSDLLTLFWANEIFDPARPDTFSEAV